MVGGDMLLCSVSIVNIDLRLFVLFSRWFVIDFVELIIILYVCLLKVVFIVLDLFLLFSGVDVLCVFRYCILLVFRLVLCSVVIM